MEHQSLHHAILKTLALLDAESVRAASAARLFSVLVKEIGKHCPTHAAFEKALDELAREETIVLKDGMWLLAEGGSGAAQALQRQELSLEKLEATSFALSLLGTVPFVRAVAVTGSVAMENASASSDIDVFLIAQKGRLWTARAGAAALLETLGRRRENSRKKGKICFNYILAQDTEAPVRNIASAHLFATAIPVFGSKELARFYKQNGWIDSYLCRAPRSASPVRFLSFPMLERLKKLVEDALEGNAGDVTEWQLNKMQIQRLAKKAKRGKEPDKEHWVLGDHAILLHHPDPKNKLVLERYHKKLKELGI